MGADRRDGALNRLELVEADELSPGDPAPPTAPPSTRGTRPSPPAADAGADALPESRRPRTARRRTLTVLTAVAALAAAFAASSLWQSWSDRSALLGSRGGVSSLATAPTPRWEAATTGDEAWAVGDVLVVVRDTVLAGLAPDDGAVVWTADLGTPPRCAAPDGDAQAGPADELVCLTGPEKDPGAWVVDADGAVTARTALGAGPGAATPVPGGVLRWERTGGVLTVSLQDARDASVLWRSSVAPDDVAREDLCRPQVSGTAAASVEHGLLVVRGCRVSAVFTPDGARLDDPGEPVTVQVVPSGADRYLRTTSASASGEVETTQLVRGDGSVERIVPGRPLVPLATDGTADPTRLLSVPSGVQALDPSGTERWTLSGTVTRVLVVAAGTAVLDLGYVVQGVDLASGRVMWSFERESLGTVDAVVSAFTDGQVAAVGLSTLDGSGDGRLVALDLEDGDVLWDERYPGGPGGFLALGGRLVHLDPVAQRVVAHG
ncbi:outer membrane protein assembly factor BamB family protein [Cellulosimicrobium cellulans]|uniref:outer membrane protein assembly factor BamB family protein n=1 Tax=Cellulosimicrobium cellulans TaxID=1710 RepID=UPI0009F4C116|nr:PQQ-binding-like beta-propeller repeat protein [Cellulosimicrobium cellulans]